MHQYFDSPIGRLRIDADQRKLRGVSPASDTGDDLPSEISRRAVLQLQEYFEKKRREFNIFFIPMGTPFQMLVWSKMAQIPYGRVATYGQLAAAIGQPTAVRAVANAVGENPFLILLPCHRVVAADGLGGFSAGLEAKRTLLRLEGVEISENTAFSEKFLFTFA